MMGRFKNPVQTVRDLATALGLDPYRMNIRSIDIHADCKELATVRVAMFVNVDQAGQLTEVVKRYRLVPSEPEADAGTTPIPPGPERVAPDFGAPPPTLSMIEDGKPTAAAVAELVDARPKVHFREFT